MGGVGSVGTGRKVPGWGGKHQENIKLFMQQAGELQSGTLVHGVLKGTNLFCYWRSEDADSGQEPLFTILINKVTTPLEVRLPGAWPGHLFLKALEGWAQSSETRKVDSVPQITKLQHRTGPGDIFLPQITLRKSSCSLSIPSPFRTPEAFVLGQAVSPPVLWASALPQHRTSDPCLCFGCTEQAA